MRPHGTALVPAHDPADIHVTMSDWTLIGHADFNCSFGWRAAFTRATTLFDKALHFGLVVLVMREALNAQCDRCADSARYDNAGKF